MSQGLLKKHEAFETDFTVHKDRVNDVCSNGDELIKKVVLLFSVHLICRFLKCLYCHTDTEPTLQENHHVDNITAKMKSLRGKVTELERAAAQRKAKLDENSAFLQFNWKADVVESWIGMPSLRV